MDNRINREWNNTVEEYPVQDGVHHLIAHQAVRSPNAKALLFGGRSLTYLELEIHANQVANYLQAKGIGPGSLIGICIDRSLDMVIGLLGILKIGAAYVPMDPIFPPDRLRFMAEDAGIQYILTESANAETVRFGSVNHILIDQEWDAICASSIETPEGPHTPEQIAYVIYTSGSTGKPKGVQIPHRALTNFLWTMKDEPGVTATDVLAAVTTISFDIAALELYVPLITGAAVAIVSKETTGDARALAAELNQTNATIMQATPATWRMLLESGWPGKLDLKMLCGGEALNLKLAKELAPKGSELWNMYGPTETTIWSSVCQIHASDEAISIGRPIANTQFHILDEELQPVPVGETGHLWIGGDGLAHGYLNRPELTAERFILDPFDDASQHAPGSTVEERKIYNTGDLARYFADGQVECQGRSDFQVKIRGYRIELGEIEAALERHASIGTAVAIVREDTSDDKRIVAYVTESTDASATDDSDTNQAAQWGEIWDTFYEGDESADSADGPADPTFNIRGWKNSYTGQQIPEGEMREWLDHTIARITEHAPAKVLEIGCGTGMILFRVAPDADSYTGLDISSAAIEHISNHLQDPTINLSNVELLERRADELSDLPNGYYDTVIINSVSQNFPSIDYFVQVLDGMVERATAGGTVFVGDVVNRHTRKAFISAIERFNAESTKPLAELREEIRRQIELERELVIDPELFVAYAQNHPQIANVDIQLKRGLVHNEMSRFRYDVAFRLHDERQDEATVIDSSTTTEFNWLEWSLSQPSIQQIDEQLRTQQVTDHAVAAQQAPLWGLRNVRNARVHPDIVATMLLDSDKTMTTVQPLNGVIDSIDNIGLDPEELWALGNKHGYDVTITWSRDQADCFDVIFDGRPTEEQAKLKAVPEWWIDEALSSNMREYANQPVQTGNVRHSISELREFLQEFLPDYMLPSAVVTMDTFPLTPNGKINRLELPAPDSKRPELRNPYAAPETDLEEMLESIWRESLRLDRVGIDDNFFDLGGNSLLSTHVMATTSKAVGQELTITKLFQFPTIRSLAQHIEALQSGEVNTSSTAAKALNKAEKAQQTQPIQNGIAIIGMVGRFPGADNLDQFWANLCAGKDSISHFNAQSLDMSLDGDLVTRPNYVPARGVLADVDKFDTMFFGINPREAQVMDPQHRVFMELAWAALENAGYAPDEYAKSTGGSIGVYAGMANNTYFANNVQHDRKALDAVGEFQAMLANEKDYLATRVSYKLNLTGPSVNVYTACSTSLVAVSQAFEHLQNRKCDMALAGGITITTPQASGYLHTEGGIQSSDGTCRPFDASGEGTVFSNGAGIVVLKRLDDAVADGDTIYAVIRGAAVNNDGASKMSFAAPSVDGQAEVIAMAQAQADISPDSVSYIEAHGTATQLGDPIEMEALIQAFRAQTDENQFCAVGSLKSNMGHLIAAAGVAGLIKAALSLKHGQIPPSLYFENENQQINFGDSPFYVNTELKPWPASEQPRRAGVSSFGIGGTNAHVILEEAPIVETKQPIAQSEQPEQSERLLILSAKKPKQLAQMKTNLRNFLSANREVNLADVAYTLQRGRTHFSHRYAVVCKTIDEAIEALSSDVATKSPVEVAELPASVSDVIALANQVDRATTLAHIGALWMVGSVVDWAALDHALNQEYACRRIPLPTYPFERKSYWIDAPIRRSFRSESNSTANGSHSTANGAAISQMRKPQPLSFEQKVTKRASKRQAILRQLK